ncbi:MAG: glycosyltransferase family 2 protein [Thermoplasmatota archaeon]
MLGLSVVILTRNEAANIGGCLAALASQTSRDMEVIVIDAASTDGTADAVRAFAGAFPVPLRLQVAATALPIGAARNQGVRMAAAPAIAFLSADAEPDPEWVHEALLGLATHDMVFGMQIHAPRAWTLAACVRALRYHYPSQPPADPLAFASNVGAAYRREVLTQHPFDDWANAAEDLRLAKRAAAAGFTACYRPRMVVRHHDVATVRQEGRKNRREGHGWAVYRHDLGWRPGVLAWGLALAVPAALIPWRPLPALLLLAAALWFPAARRAVRRRRALSWRPLLVGVLASPPFDLAFLFHYVRGLARPGQRQESIP